MMCYYLNVHFQGQRVKINVKYVWCERVIWFLWPRVNSSGKILQILLREGRNICWKAA